MAANMGALICQDVGESVKDPDFVNSLQLVVSEACTNAVKHGANSHKDAEIILQVMLDEQTLIITVKDCNCAFDFSAICEPDLENHPENGYGVFLMRTLMDEVKYVHQDGWNCITLVKHKPCYRQE